VLSAVGTGSSAYVSGTLDSALVNGANSLAQAVSGISDSATVFGDGSSALAGGELTAPASFDLAAVFADMLDANATDNNFLLDILPSL
jgi:hypothetical protein